MTGRRVLGLDLGTECGWALTTSGEVVGCESGAWRLEEDKRLPGSRLLKFEAALEAAAPDVIFYEAVHRHAGTRAAHVYGALEGLVQLHCRKHGIAWRGFPVPVMKKRATGRHMAKKAEMVEAARLAFSRPGLEDDNEADALWVLQVGLDLLALHPHFEPGPIASMPEAAKSVRALRKRKKNIRWGAKWPRA